MKPVKLKISNFRSYQGEVTIDLNDLTVLVGKNDVGKSTVLEALDIFINDGKGAVKIDKDDLNSVASLSGQTDITIGVVFDEFPDRIVIDSSNETSLAEEKLLNEEGHLEIIKKYPNGGKAKVFIRADHPTNENCADLHSKTQAQLRGLLNDNMVCEDRTRNAEMRKAIWAYYENNLQSSVIELDTAKNDAKNIWDQLRLHLPTYALFQSDRQNSEGDNEVQDPIKYAVQEVLRDTALQSQLQNITESVRTQLEDVTARTLAKIREMNPNLADTLNPVLPSTENLKWADIFIKAVSITGDQDIPLNKRGSGVKRLILLNFFRAEAERRMVTSNSSHIIYAVEEPETSQHLDHQRLLIQAFVQLSELDQTQVFLTTHSPEIVKMLNFEDIKLVENNVTERIKGVERDRLPYPSLNEVNFLAFDEVSEEYHNELYGFLEAEELLDDYKAGKETHEYIKDLRGGQRTLNIVLSEYIRHQIHHPENTYNPRFTKEQLGESVMLMRGYIQSRNAPAVAA